LNLNQLNRVVALSASSLLASLAAEAPADVNARSAAEVAAGETAAQTAARWISAVVQLAVLYSAAQLVVHRGNGAE